MGHTNSTANLSLPQFIGTDKPTWLGDVNGAFSAIDSYVGTNDAAVAAAASDASSAISQASAAVSTANSANTTAGNASTAANNAVGVANNAVTIVGVVDTKVGLLADLTTTDRTSIVNAINDVNGKDAGDITYDNTGSGLTATNVQAAIDEVAQGGGGSGATFSTLWTNPDPTQSFASQIINLASSNYDALIVFTSVNIGFSPAQHKSFMIQKGENFALDGVDTGSNVRVRLRVAEYVSDTSYNVGDCSAQTAGSSAATENTSMVPLKIVGLKY